MNREGFIWAHSFMFSVSGQVISLLLVDEATYRGLGWIMWWITAAHTMEAEKCKRKRWGWAPRLSRLVQDSACNDQTSSHKAPLFSWHYHFSIEMEADHA